MPFPAPTYPNGTDNKRMTRNGKREECALSADPDPAPGDYSDIRNVLESAEGRENILPVETDA